MKLTTFPVLVTTLALSIALATSTAIRRDTEYTEDTEVTVGYFDEPEYEPEPEQEQEPVPYGVYEDYVVCDESESHCTYMDYAGWTYGSYTSDVAPCALVEYEEDGTPYGEQKCQFPDGAVTRIYCQDGSAVDVWFDYYYSNFTTYGDAWAVWSSKKDTDWYEDWYTEEAGDDVYVTCDTSGYKK